jgi:hypothetical protein
MQFECKVCHLLVETTHVEIESRSDGSRVATCKCPRCGRELLLSQHSDDGQVVDLLDFEGQSNPEHGSARVFPASDAIVSCAWSLSNAESRFGSEIRGAVAVFERASEEAESRQGHVRSQAAELSDEASQLEQRARNGIAKARADCGWALESLRASSAYQIDVGNVSNPYQAFEDAKRKLSRLGVIYRSGVAVMTQQRAAANNWKIVLAIGAILALCAILYAVGGG